MPKEVELCSVTLVLVGFLELSEKAARLISCVREKLILCVSTAATDSVLDDIRYYLESKPNSEI